MAKRGIGIRLLACLTLWAGVQSTNAAPPSVSDMLAFKPRQSGVNISTPTSSEMATCKVELIKGSKLTNGKTSSGWQMNDSQGKILRRFFDSDGDNHIDVYSYFLDGKEAYREMDSNFDGKVDQYRWLGPNGTKWGVSQQQDGRIDTWKVISPEEVSQEVLHSVLTKDARRLEALMITKAELDAMGLPDSETNRIKNVMNQAGTKFQKTSSGINTTGKMQWVHLETQAPECLAADTIGAKYDLVKYKQASILYQNGDKHDWISIGELIQVGRAWRIVDGPTQGTSQANEEGNAVVSLPDEIKQLVEVKLKQVDETAPKNTTDVALITKYNLARAGVLEEIVTAMKGEGRELWIKQLVDCLSSAAQNDPKATDTYQKLVSWTKQVAKDAPGSNVAGYAAFREISADYAIKLASAKAEEMGKIHENSKTRLTKFVQEYPTAEDLPEAYMQLGMVNEFLEKETEAKNWYKQLADNFRQHPLAAKARGCEKRLSMEGQEFELSGATLGANTAFDIKSLKGKTVIVYYWSSSNPLIPDDFKKLKSILDSMGNKGVELVSINLDPTANDATAFLRANPLPGTHLYQEGGLESGLATQYGIMSLPNIFLINGEGKGVSRPTRPGSLEDDLKKLVK